MIKTSKLFCIIICIIFLNCFYVYNRTTKNVFVDNVKLNYNSCAALVFCMGGSTNKFSYFRNKPFKSSLLDTLNLFKFIDENKSNNFYFWKFEHGDYGTPQNRLPIRVVDTSVIDIDSTVYGKHASNCSTIYFRLKKDGKTNLIVKWGIIRNDTISLFVEDNKLKTYSKKKERKGKTRWIGLFPLKN